MLLQKRIDFGKVSISVSIVVPVVVKPETVSKRILILEDIDLFIIYGNVPSTINKSKE